MNESRLYLTSSSSTSIKRRVEKRKPNPRWEKGRKTETSSRKNNPSAKFKTVIMYLQFVS